MGLKQNIIVVNEFTVKDTKGKGSRGSTPGKYVTRYMARDGATEPVEPIKFQDMDSYVLKYMSREVATEKVTNIPDAYKQVGSTTGYGGVAFGYGQLSLSDEYLERASEDIQQLFDQGHTVMKTVLSFDEEYLREHGIISSDFHCEKAGDYRGNIDQLKLRMGIMHGLERMSNEFDDLRYIGVIQVDTEHVHAHLAMVDAGDGRQINGQQRGKLSAQDKATLRRGLDSWLDEKQTVKHLSSAVGFERRNVTSYVKKWTYDQVLQGSTPQFLLACLPEDSRMWRASSNRKEMQRPNELVRNVVNDVLDAPDSPMEQAMDSVREYATTRMTREDLSQKEWHDLVDSGREQIIDGCVNGVYRMLQTIPDYSAQVSTPTMDIMSMEFDELAVEYAKEAQKNRNAADKNDLVEFGFRMRTYSSRLDEHRKERKTYHESVRAWEKADSLGKADPASRALYDFYKNEELYHAQLASKYYHFLPFPEDDTDWEEEWSDVSQYGEKLIALELLSKDRSLSRMKDEKEAEDVGYRIYNQHGGGLLTYGEDGRKILENRIDRMKTRYDEKFEDLKLKIVDRGYVLLGESSTELINKSDEISSDFRGGKRSNLKADVDETLRQPVINIESNEEFDFNDVKALDLHHLRYDFSEDVNVPKGQIARFSQMAQLRADLLVKAAEYLEDSGQEKAIDMLPVDDVMNMNRKAREIEQTGVLSSGLAELARSKAAKARVKSRGKTVALSPAFVQDVKQTVQNEVNRSVRTYESNVESPVG